MKTLNNNRLFFLLMVLTPCVFSAAVGEDKPDHEERVLHGKDLSDKEHFHEGGEHDPDYDHEAFLGEEAEEFDNLSPEESQERLSKIVEKIDKDGDGFVTFEEMRDWIQYTQQRYISDDVERQWTQHGKDDSDQISWDSYRETVYGFLDDEPSATEAEDPEYKEEQNSYKKMEDRDRRRWNRADQNDDGSLTKEEFSHFLHPEEADHMRDIVVQETLEDIDKDGDGKINLEEYIGDMYRGDGGESEPDWVKSEREQFEQFRDLNKDGFMDFEEVKAWIIPPDFDHSEAEAKHLIYESDADQDEKLTKAEILDKYDLFVGSQATDFGEALTRHDEF